MSKVKCHMSNVRSQGFTLIELLIVIAIIAILAGGAFIALNPLGRLQDARDATRWSDASAIVSAIKIDQVDNGGYYLTSITAATVDTNYMISTTTPSSGCDVACTDADDIAAADCIDLQGLADEGYLGSIPVSPNGTGSWTTEFTGYYLNKSSTGTVTIGACESENTASISVAR